MTIEYSDSWILLLEIIFHTLVWFDTTFSRKICRHIITNQFFLSRNMWHIFVKFKRNVGVLKKETFCTLYCVKYTSLVSFSSFKFVKPVFSLDDTPDQKTQIDLLHRTDIRRPLPRWLRDNVENAQEWNHS